MTTTTDAPVWKHRNIEIRLSESSGTFYAHLPSGQYISKTSLPQIKKFIDNALAGIVKANPERKVILIGNVFNEYVSDTFSMKHDVWTLSNFRPAKASHGTYRTLWATATRDEALPGMVNKRDMELRKWSFVDYSHEKLEHLQKIRDEYLRLNKIVEAAKKVADDFQEANDLGKEIPTWYKEMQDKI